MDEAALQQLLSAGEGQSTEFKETTSTATAAIRSLAAFASQPEGGTVVFGVNNNGTPHRAFTIGAETSAKLATKIKAAVISMTTGHSLAPAMYVFRSPDRLVVHVPAGADAHGPYLGFGLRWKRSGTATVRVDVNYRQLAQIYQRHLVSDAGHLNFCPQCGADVKHSSFTTSAPDCLYYVTECTDPQCGWMDASE